MDSFRIGIVGAGGISRAHASAAQGSGGRIAVAAVVDPVEAARSELAKAHGAEAFASVEAMASSAPRLGLHAAVVCTPPGGRVPIVQALLSAGLAVLCEKPLAHTPGDAEALAKLAAAHAKTPTAVAFCHRFTPAMVEMKRQASAGELGAIVRFENTFACWHPTMATRWMSDPKVSGGGALIDTGCHSVDLWRYLVGDGRVLAAMGQRLWSGRGEANASVMLQSTGRDPAVAGFIASGWAEAARFTVGLIGTKASLYYDYEAPEQLLRVPAEGPRQVMTVATHEARFDRQLSAFADFVAGRSARHDLATFEDGLRANQLIDAAQKAGSLI